MSLIGEAVLNQVIHDYEIHEPHLILSQIHLKVQQSLKQDQNGMRDGIEMSIVCVNHSTKNLWYAGAMNPLYYVKKGIFHEIKADKKSLGGTNAEQDFTLHEIPIDAPITFYLFSDGYQDQFGGKENRKFMVKSFRQLLYTISEFPMPEQEKILEETLKNWRRDNRIPQTDDILVIGVKVE